MPVLITKQVTLRLKKGGSQGVITKEVPEGERDEEGESDEDTL